MGRNAARKRNLCFSLYSPQGKTTLKELRTCRDPYIYLWIFYGYEKWPSLNLKPALDGQKCHNMEHPGYLRYENYLTISPHYEYYEIEPSAQETKGTYPLLLFRKKVPLPQQEIPTSQVFNLWAQNSKNLTCFQKQLLTINHFIRYYNVLGISNTDCEVITIS